MSHKTKKPITTQQYARIIKGWMRKLEVEDVSRYSTHSMRKTRGYAMWDAGVPLEVIARVLNHSSPAVTMRYIGLEQADINKTYDDFVL